MDRRGFLRRARAGVPLDRRAAQAASLESGRKESLDIVQHLVQCYPQGENMESITAAETHRYRPLSPLQRIVEIMARISFDYQTVEAREIACKCVDRIHRNRVARLDPKASW